MGNNLCFAMGQRTRKLTVPEASKQNCIWKMDLSKKSARNI